jgi:predicted amidophosphoribosyltransferase
VYSKLTDLLFTPACLNCKRFGLALCDRCLLQLNQVKKFDLNNIDEVICAHSYEGWLRDRIIEYKSGNYQLGRGLAEVLLAKCFEPLTNITIVPIPSSSEKIALRQIDTIGNLANQLKKLDSKIQIKKVLGFRHLVQDQVGLTQLQRAENMQNAFRSTKAIHGQVFLLDDVVTTGSTMAAAAVALKEAGADSIIGIGLCASSKLH